LLSSNREIKTVKAINPRKSRGVLQAVALLGLSAVGAIGLLNHNTPTSSAAAGNTASGAGTTSATGSSNSGSTGSGSGSSSATKTATGDAINYNFGTIQLEVTKSNGKITAVNLIQAQASAGRDQAFSYLVTDAIQANGSNFGNLSGATYTTNAFKQALDSAISKL
jgi:uncharacterized protein with FMN-binding domain